MVSGSGILLFLLLLASANSQSGIPSYRGWARLFVGSPAGLNDTELVFEEPPPGYIFGNLTCEAYNQTGFCSEYLQPLGLGTEIIVNYSRVDGQGRYKETTESLKILLESLVDRGIAHQQCLNFLLPTLCRYVFVTCDPAYNTSVDFVYQPICRRSCEILSHFVCVKIWELLNQQLTNLNFDVLDPPRCEPLENPNGGDVPDCIDATNGGKIPEFAVTTDCFRGLGEGYNGTISTTSSGLTCQRWSEQTPHRFILPSEQYPEIAGGHNYCRNPGSRAPDGPWCFTTDPDTRWEYCDVPKCAPKSSCQLYNGTICYAKGVIGMDYVYVNSTSDNPDQSSWENSLLAFNTSLVNTVGSLGASQFASCVDEILSLMCFNVFPVCDYSSSAVSRPRQICKSYCNSVRTGACQSVWDQFEALSTFQMVRLPDCELLPEANGGDAPECFIPFADRADIPDNAQACYNEEDKGELYNGEINVTLSGKPCQKWDSTEPHVHPLSSLYRPYLEEHNYCRNPEGRGDRPWCYTTDPSTRWEYCMVPSCSESTDSSGFDDTLILILAIAIPVLVIIVLIILIIALTVCWKSKKHTSRKIAIPNQYQDSREVKQDIFRLSKFEMGVDSVNPSYIRHADINIADFTDGVELPKYPRNNIVYISDLGQGNFGVVIKAEAKNIIAGQDSTTVAVKVLKEGANDQTKKDFFREAALMHEFNHQNILKLLGVCIEQEPFCMLFEYMEFGDLNGYLRKHNTSGTIRSVSSGQVDSQSSLPIQLLVDMCINIAGGLEYLAQHHYIHRDLATRNCLIDSNFTVKIADFGLSQDIYSTDYCKLGDSALLPIRWMPPEAIMYAKFTLQSDIWSFGVVLWEVFSYGTQPYFSLSNEEVVEYVRNGNVLKHPPGTPTEIYDLMVDCWATNPDDRPTASELHIGLRRWNPDISASVSDTLSPSTHQRPYENMAAVKEMQRKKCGTLREQLSTQKLREGSAVSESSSSPASDGDASVPLNP